MYKIIIFIGLLLLFACETTETTNQQEKTTLAQNKDYGGFPWDIPQTKPDRPLSKGMERLYDNYLTPRPQDNELFSSFKHTPITGLDYNNGNG
ncbi:MAG: glycoside hydrolase, partial [Bacteroidota bacterium]